MLTPIAAALLSLSPFSQSAPSSSPPQAFELAPPHARAHVLVDTSADGTVWARGGPYKLRADADGIDFVPVLGARAERNVPLRLGAARARVGERMLALDEHAQPLLRADSGSPRIEYARGAWTETLALALDHVEQTFTLSSWPGAGDLEVTIPLAGETTYVEHVPGHVAGAGLRFDARGLATLAYSDVIAVDARGERIERTVSCVDGAIRFSIPASFLATAQYPLAIDPLIATIGIDQGSDVCRDPDVAYDAVNDVFLVVYEDQVSASDMDILSRRYSADGAFLDEVAVDLTDDNTVDPAVANNSGTQAFLIAWTDEGGLFSSDAIHARTRTASSTGQGAVFTVIDTTADEHTPDVGGSSATSTGFLIAWIDDALLSKRVKARTFTKSGLLGSVENVSGTYDIRELAVTKSSGTNSRWAVAYAMQDGVTQQFDAGVRAIETDGTSTGPELLLQSGAEMPQSIDIAGDGHFFFLLTSELEPTNKLELNLARLVLSTTLNLQIKNQLNVNDPGDKFDVAIDGDGSRYVLAYSRGTFGGAHGPMFADRMLVQGNGAGGSSIAFPDDHMLLAVSGAQEDRAAVAMSQAGAATPGRALAVWQRAPSASDSDVVGALIDAFDEVKVQTVQTGCGGANEPTFSAGTTEVGLGTHMNVDLGGTGSPLVLVGLPSSLPVCTSCTLGVSPIFQTIAAAHVVFVLPQDPALLGSTTALQGVRIAPSGAGPQCGPPAFGVSFRVSDTLLVSF